MMEYPETVAAAFRELLVDTTRLTGQVEVGKASSSTPVSPEGD